MDAFALGYAALKRGDRRTAEARLEALKQIAKGLERDTSYAFNRRVPAVMAVELEALLLWNRGKRETAIERIRGIAKEEDAFPSEFGPPDIVKPSHELLGELLLEFQRPTDAQREFARALELAPGRSPSLRGLVRAARAAGDSAASLRALELLRTNLAGADPDAPGVAELATR
jgi:tetratricopeptide (TPR) repeat protein